MNDVTKLPKWAQEKIRRLEVRVAELNDALSQSRGEIKEPFAWVSGSYLRDDDRPVAGPEYPGQTSHDIYLGRSKDRGGRWAVNLRADESLEIRCPWHSREMQIVPIASNVIQIKVLPL